MRNVSLRRAPAAPSVRPHGGTTSRVSDPTIKVCAVRSSSLRTRVGRIDLCPDVAPSSGAPKAHTTAQDSVRASMFSEGRARYRNPETNQLEIFRVSLSPLAGFRTSERSVGFERGSPFSRNQNAGNPQEAGEWFRVFEEFRTNKARWKCIYEYRDEHRGFFKR